VNIIEVTDDAEALEIARTLNEDRRAMPKAERLEVVKALREDGHSVRAIAGAVGVDPKQVQRDLAGVDMSTPVSVTGLDGKSYPARKTLKLPEREALRAAREIKSERRKERDCERAQQRAQSAPPTHRSPPRRSRGLL